MSAPGGKKKTPKRKTVARVKKSARDFDDVQIDILDSCALVCVGYDLLLASSDGKNSQESRAFVVLSHGVHLLTKASGQLDEAASGLRWCCSQCGVEQEQGGES
jgi:hypothetical protein